MCVESLLSNEHTRRVFAPLWLWMYLNVSCSAHHLRLGGAAFMLSSGLIIVQLRRVVWCGVVRAPTPGKLTLAAVARGHML